MGKATTLTTVSAYNLGWRPSGARPSLKKNEPRILRRWQKRAFKKLRRESKRIINAPTGAGKSFEVMLLALDDRRSDLKTKVVISIPQTIISDGFMYGYIEHPNGRLELWDINRAFNVCDASRPDSVKSNVRRVLSFLRNPAGQEWRIVCTHQALIRAFNLLRPEERVKAFRHVSLFIDEAHHLNAGVEGRIKSNQLSKVVKAVGGVASAKVTLMTATLFRGDRNPVLDAVDEAEYIRYNLPYDEYFSELHWLRSFSYDFVLYSGSYFDAIKELFKDECGKTIIYIPHVHSRYSDMDYTHRKGKERVVERIISSIADKPFKYSDYHKNPSKDGLIRVKWHGREIRVLDLVHNDTSLRGHRKTHIKAMQDERNKMDSSFGPDVIIALGMFKEGANYDFLDRAIIIGSRHSLVENIQVPGRLLRDAKDKRKVRVYHLMPAAFDNRRPEALKRKLNDFLYALIMTMLFENVLIPRRVRAVRVVARVRGEDREITTISSNDIDLSTERRIRLFQAVLSRSVAELGRDGRLTNADRERTFKSFLTIVKDEFIKEGVGKLYSDGVGLDLWVMMCRRTRMMSGVRGNDLGVDFIGDCDPFGFVIASTGAFGVDSFRKYRKMMDDRMTEMEKSFCMIEDEYRKKGKMGEFWNGVRRFGYGYLNDGKGDVV